MKPTVPFCSLIFCVFRFYGCKIVAPLGGSRDGGQAGFVAGLPPGKTPGRSRRRKMAKGKNINPKNMNFKEHAKWWQKQEGQRGFFDFGGVQFTVEKPRSIMK
jgi:hypothetical protein